MLDLIDIKLNKDAIATLKEYIQFISASNKQPNPKL